MTLVQRRLSHISDFMDKKGRVFMCLGGSELISLKLCVVIVAVKLNSLVPFSMTLTFIDGHSGMK